MAFKILVTGGNGQLGRSIKAISREFPEYTINYIDVDDVDLTDLDAVKAYFRRRKIDVVVNCAAFTEVDMVEAEERLITSLGKVLGYNGRLRLVGGGLP